MVFIRRSLLLGRLPFRHASPPLSCHRHFLPLSTHGYWARLSSFLPFCPYPYRFTNNGFFLPSTLLLVPFIAPLMSSFLSSAPVSPFSSQEEERRSFFNLLCFAMLCFVHFCIHDVYIALPKCTKTASAQQLYGWANHLCRQKRRKTTQPTTPFSFQHRIFPPKPSMAKCGQLARKVQAVTKLKAGSWRAKCRQSAEYLSPHPCTSSKSFH